MTTSFDQPYISVIIPVWNGVSYLERAVTSVLEANGSSIEIIVVDDGSQDDSLAMAGKLAEAHPGKIRVLEHPGNLHRGVSASRNLGISQSKGALVAFLDADDYYYPNRFDTSAQILRTQPRADAVYERTDMVFESPAAEKTWGFEGRTFGLSQGVPPDELLHHLLRGSFWATSAITIRKSFLEKTGLFSEDMSIAEDCNLWFRMAALGHVVAGNFASPVSAYFRHAQNAYRPQSGHRLAMIEAIARARRDVRHKKGPSDRIAILSRGLRNSITATLIHSVEQGRGRSTVLPVWKHAIRNSAADILCRPSMLRLSLSALVRG